MKDAGFDIDELGADGFGDPELDALAKEMSKSQRNLFFIDDGDDEFEELKGLEDVEDEEEVKAPAKKPQARKVDHQFDAEMNEMGNGGEDDDIELEDQYHEVDIMESIAAIEFEADYLAALLKSIKDKDERDFYADKIESLKFKKSTIQTNIANGYVSQEAYKTGVKEYLGKLE